ncbi:MAG TPA: hypothetical protein VM052_07885 [Candidatus Limnocylindrales bacterium]|nr:hypothetical protein [Candidatus Limnocylindrales bacterium]
MAKRHRARPRQRRTVDATHRTAPARVEREAAPVARAATHRPVRGSRTGYSRAAGAASGALDRAAGLERVFISKDLRRLALVVGIAMALLLVFGLLEGLLLK